MGRKATRSGQGASRPPLKLPRSTPAALRRRARRFPLQPGLHACVLADGDVEPHPWRALQMRTKNSARREHDAIALRSFRQCEGILNMRKSCPNEHAVRRLHKQCQADALESARNIKARFAQSRMQA